MLDEKIRLINETMLESISEKDESMIFKRFTKLGIEILEADYGFMWSNPDLIGEWKLIYKSHNLPFTPKEPRKNGRNYAVLKSGKIDFVKNLKKTNDAIYVSTYMKSFIIIPISCQEKIYGNIVLCFKKKENFSEEDKALAAAFGNNSAQALTSRKLLESRRERAILVEKQKAIQILLEQERLKTDFLANVTHELRTPLAIMKGNVDLALMGKNNNKSIREFLKLVDIEIGILSEILKDLVLITSSGQKNLKHIINKAPVNISRLVRETVKRLNVIAREKNISIKINSREKLDLFVLGDEQYLVEKLFLNVIKNALTYGKKDGHIIVSLLKEKNKAIIKIEDDGIGISKKDLPNIFERFFRGDKAHSHTSYGNHSGLGLAIARWVAEKQGGTITAKSLEGKGSTFTVTLPILKK